MRPLVLGFALLGVTAVATVAPPAGAVGTRTFDLDTLDKLSGGDLKGVAVGSDGVVRAGFTLGNTPLYDATSILCALRLGDGSVLVGTGPAGKVFKIAGDQATLLAETKSLAVTSLVEGAGGAIYAATLGEGKVFKIAQGKVDVFATLPDASEVWALALDKARTGLYAAAGPDGRVFHIDAAGRASVYFHSDEPQIVSLAVAENGDVYAGSSGKGVLYRITGPGRAQVLYDFPGEEVKAIGLTRGWVWAIANDYGEPPEPPRRSPSAGRVPAGPSSSTRPKPGKGSLYRFDPGGRPERMMHHDDTHYMALALDDAGAPYVGTGADGRVYTVNDAHTVTLMADTDERQVGALRVSAAGAFVASSDAAVFHRVVARGGPDAVWTSKVLDAGLRARFGVLNWRASGPLELSTRTGDTSTPDATWSGWSNPLVNPGPVSSPSGRYVQVRARWSRDAQATFGGVSLPFVTENVRAVVLEISAQQKGTPAKEPTSSSLPPSGGELPKHDSVMKVQWRVDNPDNDALRYRIAYRREGQQIWRDALREADVLTKTEYEWDTLALPEGRYRVRVEASDEPANPPDLVQRHALESPVVLIDNTPPVITGLAVRGRRLTARVIDGVGPIARVEVAFDGKLEWRPLAPADGVFDSREEAINADLTTAMSGLGAGTHIVAMRAFDAAGNGVVAETESP